MGTVFKLFAALLLVAFVGGGVFLVTWDIPAPSRSVERVLDDDRFPR